MEGTDQALEGALGNTGPLYPTVRMGGKIQNITGAPHMHFLFGLVWDFFGFVFKA